MTLLMKHCIERVFLRLQKPDLLPIRSYGVSLRKKRLGRRVDIRAAIPKGGPIPPTHETVAYVPVPHHLEPEVWARRGLDRKGPILWHENWQMQKDARKRALCVVHGPVRTRLDCLRFNKILPLEVRQLADQEICWFPKEGCRYAPRNKCILTARPRGNRTRWRISRMRFRESADHSMMSGIMRALW